MSSEKGAKIRLLSRSHKAYRRKKDLSVQVHPDDEYARKYENSYGKTEMWYVVDCEEGARLFYGFKEKTSKEEFEKRIKDNTLTDILRSVEVKKGDCFFIPSGTIHAIGKGNAHCRNSAEFQLHLPRI